MQLQNILTTHIQMPFVDHLLTHVILVRVACGYNIQMHTIGTGNVLGSNNRHIRIPTGCTLY